jgi:hypothetical protein
VEYYEISLPLVQFNMTFYASNCLIAIGFMIVAFIVSLNFQLKTRKRHSLFLSALFLCGFFFLFFLFLSIVLLNESMLIIGNYFFTPMTLFLILFLDSVSSDHFDPVKIGILCLLAMAVFIFSLDANAAFYSIDSLGAPFIDWGGRFMQAQSALQLYTGILFMFLTLKINYKAPASLKKWSRLIVLGGALASIGPVFVLNTSLVNVLPGFHFIILAIGEMIFVIGFVKAPRLAYILPFKALRLLVTDTNSGIEIFSYTWQEGRGMADGDLLSGMLQGISLLVKESIGRGDLRDIHLDQGYLIVNRSEEYAIASILVANKSSKILREALADFTKSFSKTFASKLGSLATGVVSSDFDSASDLVRGAFSFILD